MRAASWLIILEAFASGCRTPTEVWLTITTDVPCSQIQGTTITVGSLGAIEPAPVTTSSQMCTPSGDLGTLVIVPSGSASGEVAFRVVAGVERDPETCVAPSYGDGCIVARRALNYIPHNELHVSVAMLAACNGIACDATHTCFDGGCQSAEIANSAP